MCLTLVTKQYPKYDTLNWRVGWKIVQIMTLDGLAVVEGSSASYKDSFCAPYRGFKYDKKKINAARPIFEYTEDNGTGYCGGFHIYRRRSDAIKARNSFYGAEEKTVYKVLYRKVVTVGRGDGLHLTEAPVVCALEMKFARDKKGRLIQCSSTN